MTTVHPIVRRTIALIAVALMLHANLASMTALAQSPTSAEPAAQTYDAPQLDALLAPVALYPDQLLTQLLIAVTFPLQVVEASRWLDDPAHKSLTDQALTDALKSLSWDPSVKSLVPGIPDSPLQPLVSTAITQGISG